MIKLKRRPCFFSCWYLPQDLLLQSYCLEFFETRQLIFRNDNCYDGFKMGKLHGQLKFYFTATVPFMLDAAGALSCASLCGSGIEPQSLVLISSLFLHSSSAYSQY